MPEKSDRLAQSALLPSLACHIANKPRDGSEAHNLCTALTRSPTRQMSAISDPHGPSCKNESGDQETVFAGDVHELLDVIHDLSE